MKKIFLLVALLASWAAVGISAQQQKVFVVSGDTLSEYDHVCLPHDGNSTITVKFVRENLANKNDHFSYYWMPLGDLEKVGEGADSSATFRSTGLGKGVARLRYNNNGCGAVIDLHIYKAFNPNALGLEIEGPDCLIKGETAVYSVRPVLTRNLDAYIGVDNYYWNLTGENRPAFVDSIIYAAGDGSAVTFRVGDVSAGDEVVVNFGDCNREPAKAIRKSLGKIPPKPQVSTDRLCVPWGDGYQQMVSVINPVAGVTYKCIAPSQWKVEKHDSGTNISFTITFDSISSGDLAVSAAFEDDGACSENLSYVRVSRTWGSDAALAYNRNTSATCCAMVGDINGYEFSVEGQIPTGANIYWTIPNGWDSLDNNTFSRFRTFRPTASAALTDTLRARSEECDEDVSAVWMPVYVKPAAISDITVGETCLSPNEAYTFRAVQSDNGPQAASYTWQVKEGNNYVTKSDFTGDSLVLTVTTDMQAVRVRPNGLEGCDGEFTQDYTIVFKPAAPEGISSDGCIAYNMPDTVTFSIVNPTTNQQYAWTLPTGWTQVASHDNGQSVDVRTTGVAGTYTVSAYGVGSGVCGNSNTTSIQVQIEESALFISFMDHPVIGKFYTMDKTQAAYHWYLVQNGSIVEGNVFDNPYSFYSTMNEPFATEVGDPANSTEYTVVVEYETTTGCKARLTRGASLNPSIDYTATTPQAHLQSRKMTKQETEIPNPSTLNLFPNPTSSILNVSLQDNSKFDVRVLNMNGTIMYSEDNAQQCIVDVAAYPAGSYIVVALRDGKRVAMSMFLKK